MRTVFIPPIVDYNFLRQLPQQIADQFHANGYRVIFCGIQNNIHMKREIKENFFVYSSAQFALMDIAEQKLKIDILYNTWAKNYDYIEKLNPRITIYHSCDCFEEWKIYEPEILKNSDIVLCTSQFLYDLRSSMHKNVTLCRNGCNASMINKSEFNLLDSFKFVKKPIFCFSGAIGKWVSTNLIKSIGERYYTVLAGIEFGKEKPKNIISVGHLDHDVLVDFYYNCDFGLLPFKTNDEITQAACPIKLYEYMACGLPVLATSWHETELPEFKDVVFTSDNKDQFIEHAENMVSLTEKEILELKHECFKIAKQNTWEKRFEIIQKEIDKL